MKIWMLEPSRIEGHTAETQEPVQMGETMLIPIYGVLTKRAGSLSNWFETTSYEEIQASFRIALEDPAVSRIVLDIDSPGGEVNGLFDLCDLIYESRGKKSIEALANDDAFSAAYALASSAEKVWCTQTSGLGSIGVIATHFDQSAYDQKQGVQVTSVFAGAHKNDLSPHAPLSEKAYAALQGEVDRLYDVFVGTVARNRGLSSKDVRSTEASLYFGPYALQARLADGFKTLDSLLSLAQTSSPALISTHQPRSLIMTEEPSTTKLENQDERLSELMKLCKIVHRPELLVTWLERNMSVDEAQEALIKEHENQPVIASTHFSKSEENPLLKVIHQGI